MQPLRAAALAGETPDAAMRTIAERLGFRDFMFAFGRSRFPLATDCTYVWTSLPSAWVHAYDAGEYQRCDPRLQALQGQDILIWDQSTFGEPHRSFLAAAAAVGIQSGVALPLRAPAHLRVIMSLSANTPLHDTARRQEIVLSGGEIRLFGQFLFEHYAAPELAQLLPEEQPLLSKKCSEALQLVAKGCCDAEIGKLLDVSPRTIEARVKTCRDKLRAATRDEAVAKAIALRLIEG